MSWELGWLKSGRGEGEGLKIGKEVEEKEEEKDANCYYYCCFVVGKDYGTLFVGK